MTVFELEGARFVHKPWYLQYASKIRVDDVNDLLVVGVITRGLIGQ